MKRTQEGLFFFFQKQVSLLEDFVFGCMTVAFKGLLVPVEPKPELSLQSWHNVKLVPCSVISTSV